MNYDNTEQKFLEVDYSEIKGVRCKKGEKENSLSFH